MTDMKGTKLVRCFTAQSFVFTACWGWRRLAQVSFHTFWEQDLHRTLDKRQFTVEIA